MGIVIWPLLVIVLFMTLLKAILVREKTLTCHGAPHEDTDLCRSLRIRRLVSVRSSVLGVGHGLHGIQFGGAVGGVEAEEDADDDGQERGEENVKERQPAGKAGQG